MLQLVVASSNLGKIAEIEVAELEYELNLGADNRVHVIGECYPASIDLLNYLGGARLQETLNLSGDDTEFFSDSGCNDLQNQLFFDDFSNNQVFYYKLVREGDNMIRAREFNRLVVDELLNR